MSKQTINLTASVPERLNHKRFDQVLVYLFPQYSRSLLQGWIKAGYITVAGKTLKASDKVYSQQAIVIQAILLDKECWQAQDIALDVIYEDAAILVINKPVGLVVHPAAGNPDKTLLNALLHHAPQLAKLPRAGIIHRLDKDTSGLLVVTRNLEAHNKLTAALQARQIKRIYEAVVHGDIIAGNTISLPLGRSTHDRKKMAVVDEGCGKPAITHYRVIKRFGSYTHIKVELETGRTHQIRVHLAHIGHPIVGDMLYGGRRQNPLNFKRQALHAKALSFIHPITGKHSTWEVPLPEDMQQLLIHLEQNKP
jgi:23S rRNA pseudouridine1911/1915/1917 synthase